MAILHPDMLILVDPPRRRFRFDASLLPPQGHPTRPAFIANCRRLLRLQMKKWAAEDIDPNIDIASIVPDVHGWRNLP